MLHTDKEMWVNSPLEDKWVFNKLEIALRVGIKCGLREIPVPTSGKYIVRPIYNLSGLGLGAKIKTLGPSSTEERVPLGHFWSEKLEGDHISVDYKDGFPILTVRGVRKYSSNLSIFDSWEKVDNKYAYILPDFLYPLTLRYSVINVEFINGVPIEVHLRGNPDFENHSYRKLSTVYEGEEHLICFNNFIEDEEVILNTEGKKIKRLGFLGYL